MKLIAVVLVVVIGVGVFLYYNNSQTKPVPSYQITNEQALPPTPSELEVVEGSNYSFFYPKGYAKLDKKRTADTILFYGPASSDQTSAVGISLGVSFVSTRMDTPSTEFCKEMAQFAIRSEKNVKVVESKPVDFVKSHGCDLTFVQDEKMVLHKKPLWFKEGKDVYIYDTTAAYLLGDPQQEKDNLDLAVNQFILK